MKTTLLTRCGRRVRGAQAPARRSRRRRGDVRSRPDRSRRTCSAIAQPACDDTHTVARVGVAHEHGLDLRAVAARTPRATSSSCSSCDGRLGDADRARAGARRRGGRGALAGVRVASSSGTLLAVERVPHLVARGTRARPSSASSASTLVARRERTVVASAHGDPVRRPSVRAVDAVVGEAERAVQPDGGVVGAVDEEHPDR